MRKAKKYDVVNGKKWLHIPGVNWDDKRNSWKVMHKGRYVGRYKTHNSAVRRLKAYTATMIAPVYTPDLPNLFEQEQEKEEMIAAVKLLPVISSAPKEPEPEVDLFSFNNTMDNIVIGGLCFLVIICLIWILFIIFSLPH